MDAPTLMVTAGTRQGGGALPGARGDTTRHSSAFGSAGNALIELFHTPVQPTSKSGLELRALPQPPLTQVDLRPTSTDSESTPKIPQNPVRIWVDFRVDPDFPPAQSRVSSMNVLRQFAKRNRVSSFCTQLAYTPV